MSSSILPQEEVVDTIKAADNLIITGVTLLNDTLDEIQKSVADAIVVSLTVSMYPRRFLIEA